MGQFRSEHVTIYDWGVEQLQLCQQLPFEVMMPHDGVQMTHVCIQSPPGFEILMKSPSFYNEDDHSYISAA